MSTEYSVALSEIIDELNLETLYIPQDAESIFVCSADINRPGLALCGFFRYFDARRIQIMGLTEQGYLDEMSAEHRERSLCDFISKKPVAIIIARKLDALPELIALCRENEVPLLRTSEGTSDFTAALIAYLNVKLAPRITRHGVLVEVYGEGVLLTGDSGIGKSETAVELVKRGHRLIADDAVEIRRVSNKTLVGAAPENIRHFIELRGIGIINVRRIFGIGAVKMTEKIDMMIHMEPWDYNKVYDRMGLENIYTELLGIRVPSMTIPVKPGRNLAIIIEIAAMNNRQKKMGYNAAKELLNQLGMGEDAESIPGVSTPDEW